MSSAVRVRAFAKINLSLHVVGRRADGYHELRTVFQSIALHDVLTIRTTRGSFEVTCDDPRCPTGPKNLVWRAAEQVWTAAKRRGRLRGVAIDVIKRIPIDAGLGGGSSDAAATVRVLGRRWGVAIPEQRRIAAALGADVPYFFEGGTALGTERGDRLEALPDRRPAWVVLIVPGFGVSTKQAFAWWDRDKPRHRGVGSNDLQSPVATRHPEIAGLVRSLKRLGASQAAMTGSGSTVFGLFSRQNAALDAASALFQRGLRTFVTRTIDRRTYHRTLAAK